jgi:hypothetical protein
MPNVYYDPEKFDLTVVGDIEMYEPDYSFDTLVVWRHTKTDELYWARDSGCSCPTPFEDFRGLADLTKITSVTMDDFTREVKECYKQDDARALLRKVRKAMRG